jgi:hypothetical protein
MADITIFVTDLWSRLVVKKKKRPVGGPAARGIGVLEEQKLEVAIQQPALMGVSGCRLLYSPRIHSNCALGRQPRR